DQQSVRRQYRSFRLLRTLLLLNLDARPVVWSTWSQSQEPTTFTATCLGSCVTAASRPEMHLLRSRIRRLLEHNMASRWAVRSIEIAPSSSLHLNSADEMNPDSLRATFHEELLRQLRFPRSPVSIRSQERLRISHRLKCLLSTLLLRVGIQRQSVVRVPTRFLLQVAELRG